MEVLSSNLSYLSKNDVSFILDYYYSYLVGKEKEYEHNLLLSNGLVDPFVLLSQEYSIFKLKCFIENIIYKFAFFGTENSKSFELCNCFLKEDLLIDLNNIIVVIKYDNNVNDNVNNINDNDEPKLFTSKINTLNNFGLDFTEDQLLCEGLENIKEKLFDLDSKIIIDEINDFEFKNIEKFIFIIHLTNNIVLLEKLNYEFIIFPNYKSNKIILKLFKHLMNYDNELLINLELKTKTEIKEKILKNFKNYNYEDNIMDNDTKPKIEVITEDFYFTKFIEKRHFRRTILITTITTDDIIRNNYKEFINSIYENCDLTEIITNKHYIVINNSEDITLDYINEITNSNSIKLKQSIEDEEEIKYLSNLIKDKKLQNKTKEEIYRKYLEKIIKNEINNKNNFTILFNSSFYSILNILTEEENKNKKDSYINKIFQKTENKIYSNLQNFKDQKLNFLIKKSKTYLEDFKEFQNNIITLTIINHNSEIKHFYSYYSQYTTIMNDILNIPLDSYSSNQIKDSIDLESTLIIYKNIIEEEYEKYKEEMIIYYTEFSREFEEYFNNNISEIKKWCDLIYFHTQNKIEKMSQKFKNLITELGLRLENYLNEIIEKDMSLIMSIKIRLKSSGYLNEYLSKYLSNIQYSLMNVFHNEDEKENRNLKEIFIQLGLSSGLGVVGGIVTFSITRALSILSADAVSGSLIGPVGTIAGTTIGALSLIGGQVYHMVRNKKKMNEKFEEMFKKSITCRDFIYDKMEEFRILNKEEIESRITKIISYVELSVRRSAKITK